MLPTWKLYFAAWEKFEYNLRGSPFWLLQPLLPKQAPALWRSRKPFMVILGLERYEQFNEMCACHEAGVTSELSAARHVAERLPLAFEELAQSCTGGPPATRAAALPRIARAGRSAATAAAAAST